MLLNLAKKWRNAYAEAPAKAQRYQNRASYRHSHIFIRMKQKKAVTNSFFDVI